MKTPLIVVLAIAAIMAGVVSCGKAPGPIEGGTWVLEIPRGHYLKLKLNGKTDQEAVKTFENLLVSFDANGANGTSVILQYTNSAGQLVAEKGPSSGTFSSVPASPGSMHNTQRVVATTDGQIKAVLDSFDASFNP